MKFVKPLTEHELRTLESACKFHPISRIRCRAHIIILSNDKRQMKDIADICGVIRYTVSTTLNNWKEDGFMGLYEHPRSGRPRSLSPEDEEFIHDLVNEETRSVKKIVIALEDQRGKKVSKETVRRVVRKKRVWKRIRKSLKPKRDEEKFRRAQERTEVPEQRRLTGETDIFCFDGSGFDLTPGVPYAWQPTGEYTEVSAARSQRINVLGFMNKDNDCVPLTFDSNIDSEAVIACFNNFCGTITKKTFVFTDNAPVHRSKKFIANLPEWHKKGLYPKYLPKYSPELSNVWYDFCLSSFFPEEKNSTEFAIELCGNIYIYNQRKFLPI